MNDYTVFFPFSRGYINIFIEVVIFFRGSFEKRSGAEIIFLRIYLFTFCKLLQYLHWSVAIAFVPDIDKDTVICF